MLTKSCRLSGAADAAQEESAVLRPTGCSALAGFSLIRTSSDWNDQSSPGLEVELQAADVIRGTGHVLRCYEAVHVLGDLHWSKMLEVDFVEAQRLKEVLHFGMDCRVAEDPFLHN